MIRTILVDDEIIALKHLENILQDKCRQLEIVGTAQSAEEAVELIYTHKPQLVFLDIELSGQSGFDVLRMVEPRSFEVIFVTAYDSFAISAIKNNALDYVLKPIDKSELLRAVFKAEEKIGSKKWSNDNVKPHSIVTVPTADGIQLIQMHSILYLEASGRYTIIHTEKNKLTVTRSIGEYEGQLPSHQFIRIHNHSIVNISFIDRYIKGRGGYVVLKNGDKLEVSVRKKDDLLNLLV